MTRPVTVFRKINPRGYVDIKQRDHPRADSTGYVMEHILIADEVLGRPFLEPHQVHHINGIRSDNSHQNLVLCEDGKYHQTLHRRQRILEQGGDPDINKRCFKCKTMKLRSEFYPYPAAYDGLSSECRVCALSRSIEVQRRKRAARVIKPRPASCHQGHLFKAYRSNQYQPACIRCGEPNVRYVS